MGPFFAQNPKAKPQGPSLQDFVEGRAQAPIPTFFIGGYGEGAAEALESALERRLGASDSARSSAKAEQASAVPDSNEISLEDTEQRETEAGAAAGAEGEGNGEGGGRGEKTEEEGGGDGEGEKDKGVAGALEVAPNIFWLQHARTTQVAGKPWDDPGCR